MKLSTPLCRTLPTLLLLVAAAAVGCDDSSTGSEPDPVGEYDLVMLGGDSLPVVVDVRGAVVTRMLEGSLDIQPGGSCSDRYILEDRREGEDGELRTLGAGCSWERTGNTLVLRRGGGALETARIEGHRLILGGAAFQYLFERR